MPLIDSALLVAAKEKHFAAGERPSIQAPDVALHGAACSLKLRAASEITAATSGGWDS
jgi:hypothetical protein